MKKLCLIGNSHTSQFNAENLSFIDIIYCNGASIKGLVNENSKLQLKRQILKYEEVNPESILLFFLGQVDIEFGYYYKCVIDNIKYNIDDYINELITKYEYFLINFIKNKFIILSINPTTITDIKHNFNVCFRCGNGHVGFYSEINNNINFDDVKEKFFNETFEERYFYNMKFNDKLKKMCEKNNFKFINLWNILCDKNNNLLEKYKPNTLDHHLKIDYELNLIKYIENEI